MDLEKGALVLERYRLVKRLGQGGFATVWLAEDGKRQARVALKILHKEKRTQRDLVDRFIQEARLLTELDHPGIARAHEVHDDPHFLCYSMELIEGRTLRDDLAMRSREARPFSGVELWGIAITIARTLDYAHQRMLVHRDLKPANLILVPEELNKGLGVKLVDFGIAKDLTTAADGATTAGRTMGSYAYMSPEQTRGAQITSRTDIFALATVIFEMITLRRAWLHDASDLPQLFHLPHTNDARNNPSSIFQRLNRGQRPRARVAQDRLEAAAIEAIDRVIHKGLAVDPKERFETANDLVWALHEHLVPRTAANSGNRTAHDIPIPALDAVGDEGWPSGPLPAQHPSAPTPVDPPGLTPPWEPPVHMRPTERVGIDIRDFAEKNPPTIVRALDSGPLRASDLPVVPQPFSRTDALSIADFPLPTRDPVSHLDRPAPMLALGAGLSIADRTSTELKDLTDVGRHLAAEGRKLATRTAVVVFVFGALYLALLSGMSPRVGGPILVVLGTMAVLVIALGGIGERRGARLLVAISGLRVGPNPRFRVDGLDGDRGYHLSAEAPGVRTGILGDARRLRVRLKTAPRWRHVWSPFSARLGVTLPDGADDVLGRAGTWRAFPIDSVVEETARAIGADEVRRRVAGEAAQLLKRLGAETLETNGYELAANVRLVGVGARAQAETLATAGRALLVTARFLWSGSAPAE